MSIEILETLENFKLESEIELQYFLLKQGVDIKNNQNLLDYIFALLKDFEDLSLELKNLMSEVEDKNEQIQILESKQVGL